MSAEAGEVQFMSRESGTVLTLDAGLVQGFLDS